MTISISTLRPGLLVSLKTSVRGNVRYRRQTIEAEHITPDGAEEAAWQTDRTISDPAEFKLASTVRSKARAMITGVCARSPEFGLLCAEEKAELLDASVVAAQALAREFNEAASLTRVAVYVVVGRVSQDDAQAVRAINSEMRDLITTMEEGLRNLDAKAIRAAAKRVRNVSQILSPEAQAKAEDAVKAARAVATKIVAKAGQAAVVVDQEAVKVLAASRTAFLDLEDGAEIGAPVQQAPVLDLTAAE